MKIVGLDARFKRATQGHNLDALEMIVFFVDERERLHLEARCAPSRDTKLDLNEWLRGFHARLRVEMERTLDYRGLR